MPSDIYGQPSNRYEMFLPIMFAETRLKSQYAGGFKLHITVAAEQAEPLARVILPALERIHHKVVLPGGHYARLNEGNERGKFITIYPGPAAPSQHVLDAIDPLLLQLRSQGIRPGPVPTTRQSNHAEAEIRIGHSGLVRTYWAENYRTT
ncbi:hypothetical protein FHP25_27685 [Vineibacter terrae]|uniref:Uncharacterized protein n=1 Tax=Vineibacter terrae TaxID=2586908 RepID=A0A5C8PE15_9HYPH|nr:hypothetical protein [Vineibacter terrae]TXL72017.1 hypothetical protein FHP25_27685 [Vineibacter terrae]